jgi:tetratricopeptide (TPR) repeat protein
MQKQRFLYAIILALGSFSLTCIGQEADDAARTLGWYGNALDGLPCDGGRQGYGPYDYTNPEHRRCCLQIVESFHFTPGVETLARASTGSVTGDIDYTLRAFPNHHHALLAMIRFQLLNSQESISSLTPAECYLQRGEVFSPNDPNIPFLYGFYLHRKGLYRDALEQYLRAERINPEFPSLHYYLAKLYLELGEKNKAAQHAKRASQLGVSTDALRKNLKY